MAENSAISWTRHTWNPWMGCTKVSPACDGCYAEALMDKRYKKVQWGSAPRVRTGAHTWNDPFRWQRQAEKDGHRPFVFCASLADIFDNQVDPQWRADAFEVMRKTPRLVYLLLTKRPQNIVKMSIAAGGLPANAAVGTTIEDQTRADVNVPHLLQAKWALRPVFIFVSCEPLIGAIDLMRIRARSNGGHCRIDALDPNGCRAGAWWVGAGEPEWPPRVGIDWVITGGETDQGGHKARPTHPDWLRSLRDQAAAAGVAFHHKQNGEWLAWEQTMADGSLNYLSLGKGDDVFRHLEGGVIVSRVGKKHSGRMIDGQTYDAFPEVV